MFNRSTPPVYHCSSRAHRRLRRFASIRLSRFGCDSHFLPDGCIVETGTYRQLVNDPSSRFCQLMAAQLAATSGDVVDASPLEEEAKQDKTEV